MGRRGGSCTINDKSGKKSDIKGTKELGADDRLKKKMKERAALAKKQAAATNNGGGE